MNIVCIAASAVPSRTANSIQVMKVCDAMTRLGHSVRLYLPGPKEGISWEELQSFYGIKSEFEIRWLESVPALRRYDFGWKAVRAAFSEVADVVYVWQLQAAAIASDRRLPTLYELHDRPGGRLGPRLFNRFLLGGGAVRLVATTEALKRWVKQNDRRSSDRPKGFYAVEANGVSLELFEALPDQYTLRQTLGLEEHYTAGYAGHLYPGRGIPLILDLADRNRGDTFLLAGGEEVAIEKWRTEVKSRQLDNVRFVGHVDQTSLPQMLGACDVLLMPYENEIRVSSGGETSAFASPMKAIEYLAAGKPILSSDLPIFREVLHDDNALLLPPEELEAWDKAYQRLRGDSELRKSLGEAAQTAAQSHSWLKRSQRILDGLGEESR